MRKKRPSSLISETLYKVVDQPHVNTISELASAFESRTGWCHFRSSTRFLQIKQRASRPRALKLFKFGWLYRYLFVFTIKKFAVHTFQVFSSILLPMCATSFDRKIKNFWLSWILKVLFRPVGEKIWTWSFLRLTRDSFGENRRKLRWNFSINVEA